jgi:capsular exopolysaccharide synthesis family protein
MRLLKTENSKVELERLFVKIMTLSRDQQTKTIMITSCHEGEGTSTFAFNFSQALTQRVPGQVLLVDANLNHPSIGKAFQVEETGGLADVISGRIPLEAVLQETEIRNLKILTVGNGSLSPFTLFNSQEFKNCLEEFRKRFQFIVFDSAPIIPYSDSLYLSSKVDMILLVIEAEKTRWEVVEEGIQKLENAGNKVFGVVLNKKRYHIPGFIYRWL